VLILMDFLRMRMTAFRRDEGVTAIEYGLIASLVAVFIIGALILLGTALDGLFTDVSNAL
jgi:pilus assembly protein Flp/PilA